MYRAELPIPYLTNQMLAKYIAQGKLSITGLRQFSDEIAPDWMPVNTEDVIG